MKQWFMDVLLPLLAIFVAVLFVAHFLGLVTF